MAARPGGCGWRSESGRLFRPAAGGRGGSEPDREGLRAGAAGRGASGDLSPAPRPSGPPPRRGVGMDRRAPVSDGATSSVGRPGTGGGGASPSPRGSGGSGGGGWAGPSRVVKGTSPSSPSPSRSRYKLLAPRETRTRRGSRARRGRGWARPSRRGSGPPLGWRWEAPGAPDDATPSPASPHKGGARRWRRGPPPSETPDLRRSAGGDGGIKRISSPRKEGGRDKTNLNLLPYTSQLPSEPFDRRRRRGVVVVSTLRGREPTFVP